MGSGEQTIKVEAAYNSLALFDVTTGTKHYIAPITEAAAEQARLTIGGWLRDPER